ncbi:unnamed protein product, partial [Rotaria socialis]
MTSAISKRLCFSCAKNVGQFKCEGCGSTFCTTHTSDHRQTLNQQLDGVIMEHDSVQQIVMNNEIQYQPLLKSIHKWEQNSIDIVRKTAQEVREQVSRLLHINK